MCTSHLGADWIDSGTLNRSRSALPRPEGSADLTSDERDVLLDLTQMTLDLVGIIDPTPASDGTNVAISLGRRDWVGAGLSGVSLIPYIGDLAKVGKLGRWAQTVHKSVALAKRNARFAERARPLLSKLAGILDEIPTSLLPESARPAIRRMRAELDALLGSTRKRAAKEWLSLYREKWDKFIRELEWPALDVDRGVLWSRLPDGAAEASRKAKGDGKTTLEMALEKTEFIEKYKSAVAQLTEKSGGTVNTWEEFGRHVWKQVSLEYTKRLTGKVTAYVRFGGPKGLDSLTGAYDEIRDPLIFDELLAIAAAMEMNPRIASVQVTDIVTGQWKLLERGAVLKAVKSSH